MSEQPVLLPRDVHNEHLLANVHPDTWVNPTPPAGRYQLIVLGGGTAGLVTAAGAAGLGARVALLERQLLGGDCLNFGCVPSKGLLSAARTFAVVRDAAAFGVEVPAGARVDFGQVMERMRRLRAGISHHDSAERFRKLGVDVYLGQGTFTGPETVSIAGQTLRFRRAVIATGARAASLPIPGLAETGYLTNETVFSLTELPPRLAVIGAGAIGCELAQAFARFGSTVTLLEIQPRLLPAEEPAAADVIQHALHHDGVRVLVSAQIQRIERRANDKVLVVKTPEGAHEVLVDEILLGVGRTPNVDGLGLEAAGVQFDARKGVLVSDRLETSNPRIFAAGDICAGYRQFTHAADALARVAIQNALFFWPIAGRARASRLVIPWCTYTDPEVACVGLNEDEARAQGLAYTVFERQLQQVDRAILEGETEGFVRVLVKKGSDQILGATVVARHAGEMISELTAALTLKIGLGKLAGVIHPYPTQAESIKQVGDAFKRSRLTPLVQAILRRWFAWSR